MILRFILGFTGFIMALVLFGLSYYAFVESKDKTFGTVYLALGIILLFRSILNLLKANRERKELSSDPKDPPSE